ncbi:MAG: 50S ribosomal protein L21 [Oligoflexia bacterium]|nr:50S ribosomal protein L21 [Oligoflexia bacterium]
MYAVVKTSGRQYRVTPGLSFTVEKLEGEPGATLDLTEVLMIGGDQTVIGSPTVSGAKVTVVIEQQYRGSKILVFKKKRRKKYRNMRGHRSELTRLFVTEILTSSGSAKAETKPHVLLANREKKVVERKASVEGVEEKQTKKVAKGAGSKDTAKKKSSSAKKKSSVKKTTKAKSKK